MAMRVLCFVKLTWHPSAACAGAATALASLRAVCTNSDCLERRGECCGAPVKPCGHFCNGVKGEVRPLLSPLLSPPSIPPPPRGPDEAWLFLCSCLLANTSCAVLRMAGKGSPVMTAPPLTAYPAWIASWMCAPSLHHLTAVSWAMSLFLFFVFVPLCFFPCVLFHVFSALCAQAGSVCYVHSVWAVSTVCTVCFPCPLLLCVPGC